MANQQNPKLDPNLVGQQKQDARKIKDAPLIKVAAAKARQESLSCLAGNARQRRGTEDPDPTDAG